MPKNNPMTKKKIFLLIGLFFLMLTGLRIGWIYFYQTPEHPLVEKGISDLSDWEFNDSETITLDGEWEFYPDKFLRPGEQLKKEREFISVPRGWGETLASSPYGYGTYRTKVILPKQDEQLYGIRMKGVTSAANVYIDEVLVAESGKPARLAKYAEGEPGPFSTIFFPENNEIEIMIHVSNYEFPLDGGIVKSIKVGTDIAIQKESQLPIILQIVVSALYLLHSLYAFIIYFMGKGKYRREVLFFGLMLLLHGFTILIDDDVVLHLPISYIAYIKLLALLFISTLFSLLIFIKELLQLKTNYFRVLSVYYVLFSVLILFTPIENYYYLAFVAGVFYLLALSFLFVRTIKTIQSGYPNAMFILLFITSYTSNMIWGFIINLGFIDIPFYPFDFMFTIIFIALLLFKLHIQTSQLNEEQTVMLQKADKMKDEFLANTSHELRNPLHGIINIAQSTLDEGNFSEKDKENLTLLIDIGKRMSYTLNDLSAVTQLKDRKVKLYKEKINLQMIVILVIDMLEFLKEGKNIKLQSNIKEDFPDIYADKNRLIQILFNLIHNAIKYTEEGSITVEADYSGTMATIYVKDTGIGIPSKHSMERIFQPYERAENYINTTTTGIGIGLSVSKQLVELHGGNISFRSTNEGTTFIFTIPLAKNTGKVPSTIKTNEEVASASENLIKITKPIAVDPITKKKKASILIVDDDPINIKVLQQVLTNNYDVLTALSAKEALEKIDKNELDLIISDVMMPYMSGYELTRVIRKKYSLSELPILLVTARGLPEDVQTAFDCGANDYLIKPVNTLELKTRIEALTGLKYSVKELLRFEAAWLQAQIQPHFLFNTLNSIASLAEEDNERMVALLESFGTYLQKSFSISNLESKVLLADELELTCAYVHIEKERFGKRVHVELDIDKNLNIKIPPLSIQPLVENAIMHGVLEKVEGGTVWIKVKKDEHDVEFIIEDNGVGMSEEKVKELLDLHYAVDDGIGVKNTNRRLTKLYGKGLQISSKVGKGTIVSFKVPR